MHTQMKYDAEAAVSSCERPSKLRATHQIGTIGKTEQASCREMRKKIEQSKSRRRATRCEKSKSRKAKS